MDSSTTFLKHAGHELTRKHARREPQNTDHACGRRDDRVDLSQVEVVDSGQMIALARRARPETFTHLADATTAFLAAVRTVVETHDHARSNGHSGVERIDLDT